MSSLKAEVLLQAVNDEDCHAILNAIDQDAKTVKELSEECEIPLSTAYRKVNRLQQADLVEEKVQLGGPGSHANVYEQDFEGAVIFLDEDGEFSVEPCGKRGVQPTPGQPGD
jgi:predicted transcriptional regulator